MTNEEAISILSVIHLGKSIEAKEACNLAIKALELVNDSQDLVNDLVNERPKGKWIRITNSTAPTQMWNCSECGRTVEKNTVLDPDIFFPFCHCGADMREVDNETN